MTEAPTNEPQYFGIAEWFGKRFFTLTPEERQDMAQIGMKKKGRPLCPFQEGNRTCSKGSGVCSIKLYGKGDNNRAVDLEDTPIITCPKRFEEGLLLISWLAEIVESKDSNVQIAKEVPFLINPDTKKPAGKIDFILATGEGDSSRWFALVPFPDGLVDTGKSPPTRDSRLRGNDGQVKRVSGIRHIQVETVLEIQAVYMSGNSIQSQFEILENDDQETPPYPDENRRPDWRSSSAKRLMPQLRTKVPVIRQWGNKVSIALDSQFFQHLGGPSPEGQTQITEGDIIWMIPTMRLGDDERYHLDRGHYEVLVLAETEKKLLSADNITKAEFEESLKKKLTPLALGKGSRNQGQPSTQEPD